MTNRILIDQILLNSGDVIEITNGVTAIVGPNNTGKSSLLREVRDILSTEPQYQASMKKRVVSNIHLTFEGSPGGLFEDLSKAHGLKQAGQYNYGHIVNPHVVINGSNYIEQTDIESHWGSGGGLGSRLAQFYLRYLNAEERLSLTGNTGAFDTYKEIPSSPLQILYSDRYLESKLSELSTDAFNTGVVVNRYGGSMINLHAGHLSIQERQSPQSNEYLAEVNSLPLMQDQGDGMRAFVGMVMSIITNQNPLVLIDEPEAFLHPPQARRFGRFLADFAKQGNETRVIIATHSEDIIAGLVSSSQTDTPVSIARLTRNNVNNHIAQLSASSVREVYDDPLMKHYDMINGLFSTGVVLCEADSDCTYYRAVADTSATDNFSYLKEAHFTHSSGKARIAQAIKTFRDTAVPVAAIFDIDILQNDGEFHKLIDTVGADRSLLEPLRNTVVSAVNNKSSVLSRVAVKAEIDEILARSGATELSPGDARKIQEAVAQRSGWKDLKTAGKTLLSGDAATAFASLQEHLEAFGVFILEQGELERLHPEVPQNNKANWLREVIEQQKYVESPASPMLERLSTFLTKAQTQVAPSDPA